MTYTEAVRYLYALGNELRSMKFGLEGISTLLEAMGNPHRRCHFLHVAGTNGKGSTCAFLEAALRKSGKRTGLYTSPHLCEPVERIRVGGAEVSREEFAQAFARAHAAAERLLVEEKLATHTTYFETVTAMALDLFAARGCDIVVLETGLGGRLDATNVVHPDLCVITPIDFDHEQFLGRTLTSIAGEKAGILKPGVPAVFAPQRAEAMAVLKARASALGIPVWQADSWGVEEVHLHARGSRFRATGPVTLDLEIPLPGEHQIGNALTALTALTALGVAPKAIQRGFAATVWPGRLEWVSAEPETYLDGAHNPSGARALAAYIRRFHAKRRKWMIFGAMRDKSVEEILAILSPEVDDLVITAPAQSRALRPEAVRPLTDHPRVRLAPEVARAWELVRESAGAGDVCFITGSLFLVGEARSFLKLRGSSETSTA